MKFIGGPVDTGVLAFAVTDPLSIGISAGTSLLGGLLSSSAASSAADTQSAAAREAAALSEARYQQTRADLAPYRGYGTDAGGQLINRLGQLSSPFNPTMAELENTPGYRFTREQGLQGVQNAAAAKGLGISGAALKGAANYATGLADSTYKTQFDIDQANKTNSFAKLMALTGAGQNASAQTGTLGQQAAQNAGQFSTSGANAEAAGIVGGANAITAGINNAAGMYSGYQMVNRLMEANRDRQTGVVR